jgi:hypothetical protein
MLKKLRKPRTPTKRSFGDAADIKLDIEHKSQLYPGYRESIEGIRATLNYMSNKQKSNWDTI